MIRKLFALGITAMLVTGCSESESPADAPVSEPAVTTEAATDTTATVAATEASRAMETVVAQTTGGGIQPEAMGKIVTLPAEWPADWIIANDASFFHMSDGKFTVLDISEDEQPRQYKGIMNGSKIAQFVQSSVKPEMYIAETFLSRGQRGERTDVLTIYDKTTLAAVGEVVLPPKRASLIPSKYVLQLTDNEDKALVFNFTPATSVTVVDLVDRKVLTELPIPGCASVYPTGQNGFSTVCGDGTIYSIALDESGEISASDRSDPFFDIDTDAVFERPAMHAGVAYFPTFLGNVVPVDLRGTSASVGERWSLVGDESGGWRPGGIHLAATDSSGNLYVMMHSNAYEGSHKDPASEVWVFDTKTKKRTKRIKLETPVITIDVTRGDDAKLVATNINMAIDVYATGTGALIKTIGDFGQETPLVLHAAK